MVDYKQILRLRAEGVSQRGIAEVLGCSRNTVASVIAAATAVGLGFGEVADLAADELRHRFLPATDQAGLRPSCAGFRACAPRTRAPVGDAAAVVE